MLFSLAVSRRDLLNEFVTTEHVEDKTDTGLVFWIRDSIKGALNQFILILLIIARKI